LADGARQTVSGAVHRINEGEGMNVITVKSLVAGSFLAAGMALTALGVNAGAANAAPAAPAVSGPQYIAENGPGRGHGHGHDDDWWWDDHGGPRRWDPVDACIGVQGPFGYVQGSACV
jgi:hypothetical protein